jgi:hypothetical protein
MMINLWAEVFIDQKKQIAHSRAAKDVLENIENILGDKEHI